MKGRERKKEVVFMGRYFIAIYWLLTAVGSPSRKISWPLSDLCILAEKQIYSRDQFNFSHIMRRMLTVLDILLIR